MSLTELLEVSASWHIDLERNMSFRPAHPLSVCARAASRVGRITDKLRKLSMAGRG